MKGKTLWISLAAVVVLASTGIYLAISHRPASPRGPGPRVTAPAETKTPAVIVAGARFANLDYADYAKKDAAIRASVAAYSVRSDLSNVINAKLFAPLLGPKERKLLARNKFVVTETGYIQMFQVYENNQYQSPELYPSFITTDSLLHAYHIFYDYSLRRVETDKLFDACVKLTDTMLAASQNDLREAGSGMVKDAAKRNVAYFAVARNLLKGTPPPVDGGDMAKADIALIMAHEGRTFSKVMGEKVDFSQFVPRGHYTRSETLKKYFRAMMWYGLVPIPTPQGKIDMRPTVQALLMVQNLRSASYHGTPAMKLWERIYEPTAFYVGSADDYTVYQYAALSDTVFGKNPSVNSFGDEGKLKEFVASVKALPGPGIENFVATSPNDTTPDPYFPTGRQFRFMGQRFIADSRILQELTHPKVNGRNFPKGLDVLAALGSERALSILHSSYSVSGFAGYDSQMRKMRGEITGTDPATWQSNIYYGWLWTLQSLTKPAPAGYPSFMLGPVWQDKCLFSALGSWTELRHDTILYAKQSVSECGGGGEEPPMPKGYVEPNLEFWTKLKWLNDYTRAGLSGRGLLDPELKDKFERLGDWIDFCRNITIKELTGKKVTDEEYQHMTMFGPDMEQMMLSFAGGDILSDTDKDMALVADVHTSFDSCLEEGTGRAAAIYVIVPIEGKLHITRGAIYTQYEFMHPSSDRLTDEQWQQLLKSGAQPGYADWVKSFMVPSNKKLPPEFANFGGGC